MKNIFSFLLLGGGFFLIYISIMLMIELGAGNQIYKNTSPIQKVSADLEFYQSSENDSYDPNLWSSQNFPRTEVFRNVRISNTPVPPPSNVGITINNIVRDSH